MAGCAAVGEPSPEDSAELGVICGDFEGTCIERVMVDLSTFAPSLCDRELGADELCVAGVVWIMAFDATPEGPWEPGCDINFQVDGRVVPIDALVPSRAEPTAGVHVRSTGAHYEVSVEGVSQVLVQACEGTRAQAVLSAGQVDGLTLTFELEPNGEVYYRSRGFPLQHAMTGAVRDEEAEVGMHPFYDGSLEIRSRDGTIELPVQVVWYPGGGPANLGDRSDEELVWDLLTTGLAPPREQR